MTTAPAGDGILDQLRDAHRDIRDARDKIETAEQRRDDLIREAIARGYPTVDIAAAAGVSPPRVYQIRDRRR